MVRMSKTKRWPGRLGAGGPDELIETFLADHKQQSTAAAYRKHLQLYARWRGLNVNAAVRELILNGQGTAYSLVVRWQSAMRKDVAATTINPRISALRSLVRTARNMHLIRWSLEVPALPTSPYRDTRGPGIKVFREMLAYADSRGGWVAARNVAILHLLCILSLRRGELVGLDVKHVELGEQPGIWVLGKGKTQRQRIGMPLETRDSLKRWLLVHGRKTGPLFVSGTRARENGSRITPDGVYWIVREIGKAIGADVRPHGLRHTGITVAASHYTNAFDLMAYSRHSSPTTAQVYIDRANDQAGHIAMEVAERVLAS